MHYSNPQLPEDVNLSQQHPLKEFIWMLLAVAAIVISLLMLVHLSLSWLLPKVDFATEQKIAAYVENKWIKAEANASCRSKQEYLQQLANHLAKSQNLDPAITITVHYIDSPQKNAFATLGGHIFIMQGLLDSVASENGLAMVMAHEIAHIKHRHPITSLGRGLVSSMVLSWLGGSQGADVVALSGTALLLSFSREQELESDREAIANLQAYYGHSQGAEEFFVSAAKAGAGSEWADFMVTHPGVERRIETIKASQQYASGKLKALPTLLRADCN